MSVSSLFLPGWAEGRTIYLNNMNIQPASATAGYVLTTDSSGNATWAASQDDSTPIFSTLTVTGLTNCAAVDASGDITLTGANLVFNGGTSGSANITQTLDSLYIQSSADLSGGGYDPNNGSIVLSRVGMSAALFSVDTVAGVTSIACHGNEVKGAGVVNCESLGVAIDAHILGDLYVTGQVIGGVPKSWYGYPGSLAWAGVVGGTTGMLTTYVPLFQYPAIATTNNTLVTVNVAGMFTTGTFLADGFLTIGSWNGTAFVESPYSTASRYAIVSGATVPSILSLQGLIAPNAGTINVNVCVYLNGGSITWYSTAVLSYVAKEVGTLY